MSTLSDRTFEDIRRLMHGIVGLSFADAKKPLVASRLAPRIARLGLERYEDYVALIEREGADGEPVELGLLVDAVSEVIDIAAADIEPPPAFGGGVRRDFIRGMGKVGGRFVIILEPGRALDVEEMATLCERAQEEALA